MSSRKDIQEEKKFILEFIECYRSMTSLWDMKNPNYTNRNIREVEGDLLLEKFREKYPEATKQDVGRKINTLRSNFKRELKRLKELEKSGAGSGEANVPGLYYFDALSFIQGVETQSIPASKNLTSRESTSKDPPINKKEDEAVPKRKNKKQKLSATEELIMLASKRLKQKRSTYRISAEVWAQKLEEMNQHQAIFAEKMINDIIYKAQLGMLNDPSFMSQNSSIPLLGLCTAELASSSPPLTHYHQPSPTSSQHQQATETIIPDNDSPRELKHFDSFVE